MPPTPVFLHSEWRTASTYLWARLGRTAEGMAFHEPFHETLALLTDDAMDVYRADRWSSGHPDLDAPYFVEYGPLLQQPQGVSGYQSGFAYGDYYVLDPDLVAPQRAYLQQLIDLAWSQDRRPVLGFCRSLGRLPWLVKEFPDALHVRLVRNPVSQWLSSHQQLTEHDNPYFVAGYVVIAATARGVPYLQAVCRDLAIPPAPSRDPFVANEFYGTWVRDQSPSALYRVFWHVHTLNLLRAGDLAELVIDVDRLAGSVRYRATVTRTLAAYGISTSFSDAFVPRHAPGPLGPGLVRARREADAFTDDWQRYGALP